MACSVQYLVTQECRLGLVQAAALPNSSAPAQAAAAAAKARPDAITACPPCRVPVRVACLGGHTKREWPCCDAPAAFACDSPCGRMLPCGRHACAKPCHALAENPIGFANGRLADAAPNGDAHAADALEQGGQEPTGQALPADEACGACSALCGRRRAGCTHGCGRPCHAGACAPCGELVDSACHCGRSTVSAPCDALLTVRCSAPAERLACCRCLGSRWLLCAYILLVAHMRGAMNGLESSPGWQMYVMACCAEILVTFICRPGMQVSLSALPASVHSLHVLWFKNQCKHIVQSASGCSSTSGILLHRHCAADARVLSYCLLIMRKHTPGGWTACLHHTVHTADIIGFCRAVFT